MAAIKKVIGDLDVLLSQVLIEAAIIDYSLGPNTFSFGVSAAQNPKSFNGINTNNPLQSMIGAGGINNGQSFFNFLNNAVGTNSSSGSSIGSSLSPGG